MLLKFLTVFAFFAFVNHSFAAKLAVKEICGYGFINVKENTFGKVFPAGLSRDSLVNLLLKQLPKGINQNLSKDEIIGVGIKEWSTVENSFIAVFEVAPASPKKSDDSDEESHQLFIFKLQKNKNNQFSVVAKSSQPLVIARPQSFSGLDLAPYTLQEGKPPAVGLRTCISDVGTGFINSLEVLHLYQLNEAEFVPVLDTPIACEQDCLRDCGKGFKDMQLKGSMMVMTNKTKSYFDWKKNFKGLGSAVYQWTGHKFESKDKEPLAKKESCIELLNYSAVKP